MSDTTPSANIKTRVLIISDTHGVKPKPQSEDDPSTEDELTAKKNIIWTPTGYREPLARADVAIHCGDLTKRSTIAEFENTFAMLRRIPAPIKLVIAGNHDLALETGSENRWDIKEETIKKVHEIVDGSKPYGVHYLTEGAYEFDLPNGAHLKVFASQYTPAYGGWAFQYLMGHDFVISKDTDIAITHGPPQGILDSPRWLIHCFGHIHEAWGSQLVKWAPEGELFPIASVLGHKSLKGFRPNRDTDADGTTEQVNSELIKMSQKRGAHVDLVDGDVRLQKGEHTLFVNAAIMDIGYRPSQMPWIVDIDLPRAERQKPAEEA